MKKIKVNECQPNIKDVSVYLSVAGYSTDTDHIPTTPSSDHHVP